MAPAELPLVELQHVIKRYGNHTVLNGVSLAVDKGEIIAIIGRSGSGKSTLLRCVNGLEPIQGGSVRFEGTTVNDRNTDLRKLRQHVGWSSPCRRTRRRICSAEKA